MFLSCSVRANLEGAGANRRISPPQPLAGVCSRSMGPAAGRDPASKRFKGRRWSEKLVEHRALFRRHVASKFPTSGLRCASNGIRTSSSALMALPLGSLRHWRRRCAKRFVHDPAKLLVGEATAEELAVDEEAGRTLELKALCLGVLRFDGFRLFARVQAFIESLGIKFKRASILLEL